MMIDAVHQHAQVRGIRGFSHDERFLYLYLSLMIAVFSIITVLNLQVVESQDPHIANEATSPLMEGAHTLFGDRVKSLTTHPLLLFKDQTTSIDEGAFEGLAFLLRSHDVNALVKIVGDAGAPEMAYAKALTLQRRLEGLGFVPSDARVEVLFIGAGDKIGGPGDITITLSRY